MLNIIGGHPLRCTPRPHTNEALRDGTLDLSQILVEACGKSKFDIEAQMLIERWRRGKWRRRVEALLDAVRQFDQGSTRSFQALREGIEGCASLAFEPYTNKYVDGLGSEYFDIPSTTTAFSPVLDLTIIPIDHSTDLDERKMLVAALYAEQPVLVSEVNVFILGGVGRGMDYGKHDLAEIAQANGKVERWARAFSMPILPRSFAANLPYAFMSGTSSSTAGYRCPMQLEPESRYSMFMLADRLDHKKFFTLEPIILPLFENVEPELLRRIKDEETDAFARFRAYLQTCIPKLAKADRESVVEEELAKLDEEAAKLRIEAKKVSRLRVARNITIGTTGMSLAVASTLLGPEIGTLAGIIGSGSLFTLFNARNSWVNAHDTMKQSSMFVPFLAKTSTKDL